MTVYHAFPPDLELAWDLARADGGTVAPLALHRFPDGESLVSVLPPHAGADVALVSRLHDPDAKFLPLVFSAQTLRELGAARVGLVAPYLPYLRQDRRFAPGQCVSSRIFAAELGRSVDWLVTTAPHLHRIAALEEVFPIPCRIAPAQAVLAQWIARHVVAPCVVGPDGESRQWVEAVAQALGAPWRVMEKRRRGDADVSVRSLRPAFPAGATAVIVDDIAASGATLLACAQALRQAGVEDIVCAVVHGLFGAELPERLRAVGVRQLVCSDSVPGVHAAMPLAPVLGAAVRSVPPR